MRCPPEHAPTQMGRPVFLGRPVPRLAGWRAALLWAGAVAGVSTWGACATAGEAGVSAAEHAGGATGLSLIDPRGDDHGPGTYVYPQGTPYVSGAFDLTALRLRTERGSLLVEATFARRVPVATVRLTADQVATLPVLAVDLYLDLDCVRGSGRREGLPGRQVRLVGDRGWEAAIVLHPTPAAVRGLYERAIRDMSVWVPRSVRVRGRTLRARVPLDVLEGRALHEIGVAVAVSGVVFGATFRGAVEGAAPTAFVREVTAEPGQCGRWDEGADGSPCTFGGCRGCGLHPRVIDALAAHAGDQERALARYDTARGIEGELPVVGAPCQAAPPGVRSALGSKVAGGDEPSGASSGSAVSSSPTAPDPPVALGAALRGEVRGRDGAVLTAWFVGRVPREGAVGQAVDAGGAVCGAVVVTERLSRRLVLLRALKPLVGVPATVRFSAPR